MAIVGKAAGSVEGALAIVGGALVIVEKALAIVGDHREIVGKALAIVGSVADKRRRFSAISHSQGACRTADRPFVSHQRVRLSAAVAASGSGRISPMKD